MIIENQIEVEGSSYEVCGEIGEGGVGHVFVVTDAQNNKFALKVVPEYGRNPIIKQMVDKEIQIQSLFTHDPYIIKIIANKVISKRMYIVFELGSCSLRNIMNMEAHIDLQKFLSIATAISKGVMSIHTKGLIHRDIKPQNIICVENLYKITDFGSMQEGTTAGGMIGTPLYLSPQILTSSQYDQGVDIWSLGVSLFQTYFKIHPFYYEKQQTQSFKQVREQLIGNINSLTPHFSMLKFLDYLQSKKYHLECESIRNKILVTPPQIILQFQYFFSCQEERPPIQHFVAVFENTLEKIRKQKAKQCQLTEKITLIPSDIQLYIITLNTFYSLASKFGTTKYQQIQLCFQMAIRYWSDHNHQGIKFIEYQQKVEQQAKDANSLWVDIKDTLFSYWLQLSANKQLFFFEELPFLKIRVLICGAMYQLKTGSSRFLKTISSKLDRSIKSIQELDDSLVGLELVGLKRIQDSLILQYYKK